MKELYICYSKIELFQVFVNSAWYLGPDVVVQSQTSACSCKPDITKFTGNYIQAFDLIPTHQTQSRHFT